MPVVLGPLCVDVIDGLVPLAVVRGVVHVLVLEFLWSQGFTVSPDLPVEPVKVVQRIEWTKDQFCRVVFTGESAEAVPRECQTIQTFLIPQMFRSFIR